MIKFHLLMRFMWPGFCRCALLLCSMGGMLSRADAQVGQIPTVPQAPASVAGQYPLQELFPDALCGMEMYYRSGRFGEMELILKKYYGSRATVKDNPEKLVVRETLTGIVAAQPILQLQSLKVDTGLVNVRCMGYAGAFVKVATYTAKLKLMSPMMGGYDVSLGYCCWDIHPGMVNIEGMSQAKKQGSSLNLHIPEIASLDSNASPVFMYTPVLTTCSNQLVSFYARASDADRDSLAYSFCALDDFRAANGADNPDAPDLQGAPLLNVTFPGGRPPFQPIAYMQGYDFAQPMKDQQMIIDAQTGMITMKPERVGDYLIGIAVKEYRNKKLLGTVKRIIKIKVVS